MADRTRIPPTEITGIRGFVLKRFSRRTLGEVPEAMGVMWHHQDVLTSVSRFGQKVQAWDRLDDGLKTYAHMAVASLVGCSWCLDFNYFRAHGLGIDDAKASEVPRWRDATVFTSLERDVMEYAEAMSQTPPTVTDELSDRLLDQLGAPAMVELAATVGFANLTTRCNTAMGIEAQGFSSVCALPLADPSPRHAPAP